MLSAAEALSQFPGPPLEDPPTSPPRNSTGARGGERGGTTGARAAKLPRAAQRRGRCASSPGAAVAAQPTEGSRAAAALRPTCHQAKRLARRSSRCEHSTAPGLQRPGSGLGGCPGVAIWPARHRAERSAATCKPVSSPSGPSFTRSVKEAGPAISGHGKGPPRVSAGSAGLTVFASGMEARQGRDARTPVARRAARQPGPAQRGDAQAHRDLADQGPHADDTDPESTCPGSTQTTRQVLHHAPENGPRHQHPTATRGRHSEPSLA